MPHTEEHATLVDLDDTVPLGIGRVADRRLGAYAGVVDEDADRAVALFGRAHDPRPLVRFGHIEVLIERVVTLRPAVEQSVRGRCVCGSARLLHSCHWFSSPGSPFGVTDLTSGWDSIDKQSRRQVRLRAAIAQSDFSSVTRAHQDSDGPRGRGCPAPANPQNVEIPSKQRKPAPTHAPFVIRGGCGGYNVYPRELEGVLYGHPAVRGAR